MKHQLRSLLLRRQYTTIQKRTIQNHSYHNGSSYTICKSNNHMPLLSYHTHRHNIRKFGSKTKIHNLPDVGEGTVEVDILEWYVKPGDKIKPLSTIGKGKYEKADVDILAPTYDGIIKTLIVPSGNIAIVGEPLIEFEIEDDDGSSTSNDTTNDDTNTQTQQPKILKSMTISKQTKAGGNGNNGNNEVLALPSTKRLARENDVDLSKLNGTGKDGRILKEDVMDYLHALQTNEHSQLSASYSSSTTNQKKNTGHITKENAKKPLPKRPKMGTATVQTDRIEKVIGVKRAMVKKMNEANKVPMFGYSDEILMDNLMILRKSIMAQCVTDYGIKLSFMPFILKATSLALSDASSTCLNAYINDDCSELTHKMCHNIGVAVDSPEGLIVPNIKHCEQKSVLEIAQSLDELVERARNSQMTNADITDGTFTLSNIGAIGGTYCSPICFVPEVCIGALGSIKAVPRYDSNDNLVKSNVMAVSWSADHRIIDGATVARFSNKFKEYIENPSSMLLHLR